MKSPTGTSEAVAATLKQISMNPNLCQYYTERPLMSDTIPKFVVGDHVRIMQTSQMEANGYANKKGKVTSIDTREVGDSGPSILIELDEPMKRDTYTVTEISVYACNLMKCEEPTT